MDHLANKFLKGDDKYPKTFTSAYKRVSNWSETPISRSNAPNDGSNFYNNGQEDATPPKHKEQMSATKEDGGGASTMIGNNVTPLVCF